MKRNRTCHSLIPALTFQEVFWSKYIGECSWKGFLGTPVRECSTLENLLVHLVIHFSTHAPFPPSPQLPSLPPSVPSIRLSTSLSLHSVPPILDLNPSCPCPNLKSVSGSFSACESVRKPREKLIECLDGEEPRRGWGPGWERAAWEKSRVGWARKCGPVPDLDVWFLKSRTNLCIGLCAWQ